MQLDTAKFRMLDVSEFQVSRLPKDLEFSVANGVCSLVEVHRFDLAARCMAAGVSGLVFLIGREINQQKKSLFLIGCHLILTHGLEFEEACLSLKRFSGFIDDKFSEWSVGTGLRSFCCAKCMDWFCLTIQKSTQTVSARNATRFDQLIQDDGCVFCLELEFDSFNQQ